MAKDQSTVSRRDFIKTTGGAVAASVVAASPSTDPPFLSHFRRPPKMRYALVGTGIRGINMWGRDVAREYSDYVDFVGLCDINPGRLAFGKDYIGVDCPTFTDFSEMMRQTRPDTLCVTTVDSTHDEFIVAGMETGCDIVTEKPLTTDEFKCQEISMPRHARARTSSSRSITATRRIVRS